MGIPLKRGRFFAPSERLDAAKQAIISESMAKEFFRSEDPLGRRLNLGDQGIYEIVGIVGDVRTEMAQEPEPTMYLPLLKGAFNMAALVVRTAIDPNGLALPIQREVARLDSDLPVANVLTMEQVLARGYSQRTFSLTLISLFATLATALAAIGLYGLLAYSIRQRTGELGIRMALGATPSRVVRMALRQGLKPALLGLMAGLCAAAGLTRVLESLLFDVKSLDGQVFALVAVLLFGIAGAACVIPARRAARIDPAVALRSE
jgi:putative ABC transport system permease protein